MVDAAAEGRYIALGRALLHGVPALVEKLLNEGLEVNRPISLGVTLENFPETAFPPILLASFRAEDSTEMVKLLLARGADPNGSTSDTLLTPLWQATVKCDIARINLLLNAGANPNYQLRDQDSALGCCLTFDQTTSDLPRVAKGPVLRTLLEHGADPNGLVKLGRLLRPIHIATELLDAECTSELIAYGADPDPPVPIDPPLRRVFLKLLRLDDERELMPPGVIGMVSQLLSAGASPVAVLEARSSTVTVDMIIAHCSRSSPLTRLIVKCLSLVVVAARFILSLPQDRCRALCEIFESYHCKFTGTSSRTTESDHLDLKQRLIRLALQISPVLCGKRLK